jgi:FkbM family methyltransferase
MSSHSNIDAAEILRWAREWNAVSFEPLASNCVSASAVLSRFGKRSRFVCKALSDRVGTSSFAVQQEVSGSILVNNVTTSSEQEATTIDTTTLDAELGSAQVFFLKLDLQGHEPSALLGARRMLAEHRVSWLFTEFDPHLLHVHSGRSGKKNTRRAAAVGYLELLHNQGFVCKNVRARSYMPWLCNGDNGACWTDLLCQQQHLAAVRMAPGPLDRVAGPAVTQPSDAGGNVLWINDIMHAWCQWERKRACWEGKRRIIGTTGSCNASTWSTVCE